MRRPALAALASAAALALTTLALAPSAGAAPSPTAQAHNVHVCAAAVAGSASCHAIRHDRLDAQGKPAPAATAAPSGYGALDIESAYGLGGGTSGRTVAIVDAYDDPNAAPDLATYRSKMSLPPCSYGTKATDCFRKVSQTGNSTSLPARNGGWAQEISLDLDMVSAACPGCHILLVEANSSSFADLQAAVKYAADQSDVYAISNSYGGSDDTGVSYPEYENAASTAKYGHRIAVTASTGDNGYQVQAPASFTDVVAVGGTKLTGSRTTGLWSQTAWSGAGSGCSDKNGAPSWQSGTTCGGKANADVSAVADPNTGVAVYDSYAYQGYKGWMVFGGTSASSPIIASAYAQGSFATASTSQYAGQYTWGNRDGLTDVSGGSNGGPCSTSSWCNSVAGWDGPTGLGTPKGLGAF